MYCCCAEVFPCTCYLVLASANEVYAAPGFLPWHCCRKPSALPYPHLIQMFQHTMARMNASVRGFQNWKINKLDAQDPSARKKKTEWERGNTEKGIPKGQGQNLKAQLIR